MTLSFALRSADPAALDTPLLAVLIPAGGGRPEVLVALDDRLGGAIGRSFERRDFRGTRDETLHIVGGPSGPQRVLLVGAGSGDAAAIRRAASIAGRQAAKMGVESMAIIAPTSTGAAGGAGDAVEAVVIGVAAGAWEYRDLKSPPGPDERRNALREVTVLDSATDQARASLANGEALAHGYALARRLAQMPGNVCTPDLLAETARELAERHGLGITVLGRADMEREKMGAFLSVAQGTPQDPKLITLEYRGGAEGSEPVVLVGKGLCFDTGGISIKPADRMEFMKFDMCGAAGVLGAMEALGRMRLPVNVVGIIGTTTNMPSGTAVKPGDVVTSHLGKSIEVINTDAEGRLVLADLLSYAKRFQPAVVLDAATLTGACVIALGHNATGVFGVDEALVNEVLAAARRASEPGWPLPVWDDYKEQIKSDVADVKNTGGRAAGAITAALFLKEFVDGFPWVHLDIAGTAYSESDLVAIPRGPTGTPVGTFVEFIRARAT
jgi:leucyl aminopeptidase